MTIYQLILLQVVAHLVGDFILQPKAWCDEKSKATFTRYHFFHSVIVFLVSYLFSFDWYFGLMAFIIGLSHYFIDVLKSKIGIGIEIKIKKDSKKNSTESIEDSDKSSDDSDKSKNITIAAINNQKAIIFFTDQFLHFAILIFLVWLYSKNYSRVDMFNFDLSLKKMLIVTAFVFCAKPANILIKNIFDIYKLNTGENDLPNAGKVIGVMERFVTLALILMDQYEAVGLLIAAKSILRYNDNKKTEYVLVGTLLSFGFAILLGALIGKM